MGREQRTDNGGDLPLVRALRLRSRRGIQGLDPHGAGRRLPCRCGPARRGYLEAGPDWRVEILNLPGHTPGHLGIWDAKNDAAIIIDATLETGIYDRGGNRLLPPRYFDAAGYQNTVRTLRSLHPGHLLTAHYPPMRDEDAIDFLDRSLDFTLQMNGLVREGLNNGVTDLWELTKHADAQLGPYPESMHELGAGVRAHMGLLGPFGAL